MMLWVLVVSFIVISALGCGGLESKRTVCQLVGTWIVMMNDEMSCVRLRCASPNHWLKDSIV